MMTGAIIDLSYMMGSNNEFTFGKGMIIEELCYPRVFKYGQRRCCSVARPTWHRSNNNKIVMSLLLKPNMTIHRNQSLALSLAIKF